MHPACDDWDQHWRDHAAATEAGPSPRYRERLVLDLLRERGFGAGSRLLDIGSGMGEFAGRALEEFPGAGVLGLELSARGVAIASRNVPRGRFLQRDLLREGPVEAFEATHGVCTEVLEHLDDPGVLLRNVAPFMAKGCQLVITVPGGPMCAFYRHIGHRRHYSPGELRTLLESAGFRVDQAFGAGFPFFNLFRLAITLRGDSLIRDVTGQPSAPLRAAMAVFDLLFRFNLRRWGWQTVAVAAKP